MRVLKEPIRQRMTRAELNIQSLAKSIKAVAETAKIDKSKPAFDLVILGMRLDTWSSIFGQMDSRIKANDIDIKDLKVRLDAAVALYEGLNARLIRTESK